MWVVASTRLGHTHTGTDLRGVSVTARKQPESERDLNVAIALGDSAKGLLSELSTELRGAGGAHGDLVAISGPWNSVLGADAKFRNLLDRVHPDDLAETREAFFASTALDAPATLRNRLRRDDGSYSTLEWHIARSDGEPGAGVARDVSEEVRLAELVADREELLRESQHEAQLGHYIFDVRTDRWTPSDELAEIFGIDDSYCCDFEGWLRVVHPADRESMRHYVLDEVLAKCGTFDRDYRIQRISDGEGRLVHGRGRLKCDESGAPVSLFGVIQDMTDRLLSEQAMEREHGMLERAEEIAHAGSWRLDLRTGVVTWSEGMHELFGIDHESFPADIDSLFVSVHPEDVDELRRLTSNAIASARPQPVEHRIVRNGGEIRWVHGEAAPELDADGSVVALVGYYQDVTPLKRYQGDLLESNERLEDMVYEVAEAMGKIVEIRDPYTQGHQDGVANIAEAIALEMGLSEDDVAGVKMASIVHDIGKLGVPTEILTKPGTLSQTEFELIKVHPQRGYEILAQISFPWPIAEVALQHHERMDGSGYPKGLKGEDILPLARIVAVADVIEAMAAHRPYRPALGIDAAIAEVRKNSPVKYDPDVAAACVRLFEAGKISL